MKLRKNVFRAVIFSLAAFLLAFAIAFYKKHTSSAFTWARSLCDGCFVSAVIFASCGAALLVLHKGGFDTIGFALSRMTARFKKNDGDAKKSLYEYSQEKKSSRKNTGLYIPLFAAGVALLAASIIFVFFSL